MSELIFYRQARVDGGMRSGIELDGTTLSHRFEEGPLDPDPTLIWYVELRCEGPGVPDSSGAAYRFFLEHASLIAEGFSSCASELRAGVDPDIYPLRWEGFPRTPPGVRMILGYSATRRVDARRMGEILGEIGSSWVELIRALEPVPTASE